MTRSTRLRLALVLGAVLAAGSARANVWESALSAGQPDPTQELYESKLRSGDEIAMAANSRSASPGNVRRLVQLAADAYREAAAAKPNEGEPYFRLGRLLYSFYFECNDGIRALNASPLCLPDPTIFDRRRAEEVIDAWNAFEARSPLDPRLSVHVGDSEVLFRRAILHTKLATRAHLEAAARDYEKILARSDASTEGGDDTVWSNLAETYMMLDRLDEAIDTYREALRRGASTSTMYGLAVAMDRDERGAQARELIRSQGQSSMDQFHESVMRGQTFFVPRGEEYYYFALAFEAFDERDQAVDAWQAYLRSGAHPEFQPRARQHLDALVAARKRKAIPLDPPWHGLFH